MPYFVADGGSPENAAKLPIRSALAGNPVRQVGHTPNFQITKLSTQFSADNFVRHSVYVNEPSWISPSLQGSLYSSMSQLGTQFVEIPILGSINPPGDGSTPAFDFLSPSEGAALNFSKLDMLLDEVTSHGMMPYLRYFTPKWVQLKYNNLDCSAAKITDLGGLYNAITAHIVSRYGTQTRNWIFSFDNERGLDAIGGYYCNGAPNCWVWDVGSDYLSNYTDQLAARIKAVDPNLKVAAWESFPGYNYYLVNYLIGHGQTARLNNVDILSAHGYVDFGAPVGTTNHDLQQIDANAGPAVWNGTSSSYTTRGTYGLLNNNGLSRITLWYGENNLSSTNTDPRNSDVAGGLYYVLSALKQGESGLVGESHWWDIGSEYGFIDWTGAQFNDYYGFLLLSSKVAFSGAVSYRQVTPDNWDSSTGGSPIRVFAVTANGISSLVVFNIDESSSFTKSFSVQLPNPTMSCVLEYYKYNQGRITQATQALSPPAYSQSGGTVTFSSTIEPLTMAVFRFIQ